MLKETLQRKRWTIYQLASLQSHLDTHQSILVGETAEFDDDSDGSTADDIHTAIEAFISAVSRIVVSEQGPFDSCQADV